MHTNNKVNAKFYVVHNSHGTPPFTVPAQQLQFDPSNVAQQQQQPRGLFGAQQPQFGHPPVENVPPPMQQSTPPVFQHRCKILPCPIFSQTANIKSCRGLENRMIDKMAENKWDLETEFKEFKLVSPTSQTGRGKHFNPDSVSVSGKILEKLHSIMLYNTQNARLKLKLSADLIFQVSDGGQRASGSALTTLKYETELFPQLEDGQYDHSKYTSVWKGLTASIRSCDVAMGAGTSSIYSFEIRNVCVSVDGTEFDLNPRVNPNSMESHHKTLLETGLCSDITIIAKDEMEIPCHELFLIGQSSVLQSMLKESNYVEAKTRQIPMDRTKEEVMAFLEFLYCGELEDILDDTALGVSMYEMGHYHDVRSLEWAVKSVLLSRPGDSFDVDTALRLFHIARGSGDADLKQKAADVLEGKTHEDIFSSGIFNDLSPEAIKELFVMSRRKF